LQYSKTLPRHQSNIDGTATRNQREREQLLSSNNGTKNGAYSTSETIHHCHWHGGEQPTVRAKAEIRTKIPDEWTNNVSWGTTRFGWKIAKSSPSLKTWSTRPARNCAQTQLDSDIRDPHANQNTQTPETTQSLGEEQLANRGKNHWGW